MKFAMKQYSWIILIFVFFSFTVNLTNAQDNANDSNQKIITEFENQVKEYIKVREKIENELPKLSKDATPEEIEKHKMSFLKSVQSTRMNSKQGDLFTPEVAAVIRNVINFELQDKKRNELIEKIFEADTKGVPIKVNILYPEAKELMDMPPTLLLKLPQLPKQMRYRFIGKNLLLVDRENGLIIDFMPNAVS